MTAGALRSEPGPYARSQEDALSAAVLAMTQGLLNAALIVEAGSEPLKRLRERLQQSKSVLTLQGDR